MNGHISSNGYNAQESFTTPNPRSEIIPSEPGEPISLALFAQGNLPNFETSAIPAEIPNTDASQFTSYLDQPLPPIPHYEMALLPEDMAAFFDQHTTTDPQIELPWWLHNLTNVSHGNGPIDQESSRTNRLVQRWLERWGKQPSSLTKTRGEPIMMDASRSHSHDEINAIFAHLDQRDVEQFYASYQLWLLQQHIAEVQARIQSVTQQIAENQERLQRVHPSAIALATLARLQSNGVNDIDLLDRMLARGEDWLDRTMQRLAYCEKFDFIRDNYTEWCEHALEGAYDWIDSVDEAQIENGTSPSPAETSEPNTLSDAAVDAQAQTTEEMLLLKLMSDEDEALMQAPTLKIAAISPAKAQEGR